MMLINKITANPTVDFAAEELKKYLRMMMPEGGDVKIVLNPCANDGFRLGIMENFGLPLLEGEDCELDDVIYIDCDERGGIISGANPRAVLLAVYEYLRHNGCRWLFPGVDGELIPMKDIAPVKLRHTPSMRYRGQCIEGHAYQEQQLETIDFLPKIGMNLYMMQFEIPHHYKYYNHLKNSENLAPETTSARQRLQWKRECEAEIAKRSLQFHDIGHGFTSEPFGINGTWVKEEGELDKKVPPESRKFIAKINGERKLFADIPGCTNFCMSNPEARRIVAEYIRDFSKKHLNIDYLHVWLADGTNNHCECKECRKKTPADFYVDLLNETDEILAEAGLDIRIVFICYVDTFWAPVKEKIKNPDRFVLLFAPIYRSYARSLPNGRGKTMLVPYNRNKNVFPPDLASSLDYLDEWKKNYNGPIIAFEYHFWRHYNYSISGQMQAKILFDDVKAYRENGFDGIIQCGSQRALFPSALRMYTFAMAMYDEKLSYKEIEEDYLYHLYGEDWKDFRTYLLRLEEALPFDFFSRDSARLRKSCHTDSVMAKSIARIREITKEGRALINAHYNSDYRVRTVGVRLLEKHAEYCDLISDWIGAKARGEFELAKELLEVARIESGKFEVEIRRYFDHGMAFGEFFYTLKVESECKIADVQI